MDFNFKILNIVGSIVCMTNSFLHINVYTSLPNIKMNKSWDHVSRMEENIHLTWLLF